MEGMQFIAGLARPQQRSQTLQRVRTESNAFSENPEAGRPLKAAGLAPEPGWEGMPFIAAPPRADGQQRSQKFLEVLTKSKEFSEKSQDG